MFRHCSPAGSLESQRCQSSEAGRAAPAGALKMRSPAATNAKVASAQAARVAVAWPWRLVLVALNCIRFSSVGARGGSLTVVWAPLLRLVLDGSGSGGPPRTAEAVRGGCSFGFLRQVVGLDGDGPEASGRASRAATVSPNRQHRSHRGASRRRRAYGLHSLDICNRQSTGAGIKRIRVDTELAGGSLGHTADHPGTTGTGVRAETCADVGDEHEIGRGVKRDREGDRQEIVVSIRKAAWQWWKGSAQFENLVWAIDAGQRRASRQLVLGRPGLTVGAVCTLQVGARGRPLSGRVGALGTINRLAVGVDVEVAIDADGK